MPRNYGKRRRRRRKSKPNTSTTPQAAALTARGLLIRRGLKIRSAGPVLGRDPDRGAGGNPVAGRPRDRRRSARDRHPPHARSGAGEHQVRERAWLTIVGGEARIEAGPDVVVAGPGTLPTFEPGERHRIESEHGAQVILILPHGQASASRRQRAHVAIGRGLTAPRAEPDGERSAWNELRTSPH